MFGFLIIVAVVVWYAFKSVIEATRSKEGTRSDDGHVVRKEQDMTCNTKYGHDHPETKRFIVHEDPDEGYVVLNGVKRRIQDCKDL